MTNLPPLVEKFPGWTLEAYQAELRAALHRILCSQVQVESNQIVLPEDIREQVVAVLSQWQRREGLFWGGGEIGKAVPADYDAKVQGWTTQSLRFRVEKYPIEFFALANFLKGDLLRCLYIKPMEVLLNDHLRKPWPWEWKQRVESRSVVPTVAAMPRSVVVMPFISGINAYDVFARSKSLQNTDHFPWVQEMDINKCLQFLTGMTLALANAHNLDRPWGEAILPNFIFTRAGLPIIVDPETIYQGLSELDERATDVSTLILSTFDALDRNYGNPESLQRIIDIVFNQYPDKAVIANLARISKRPLSRRQQWRLFDGFAKYRIGGPLAQYQKVRAALAQRL